MEELDKFAQTKVLVVGDVMLDRYWWGDVTRISPEAPVPVVRLQRDTYAPGGAANVAVNAVGLRSRTTLLGLVGDDTEAHHLRESLASVGLSHEHLAVSRERPTNVKTRVVAHNQQIVRVDREVTSPLSAAETALIIDGLSAAIDQVDVVLVSDYAKGLLTTEVLGELFKLCKAARKFVVVDPKGKDYSKYHGASIITPNRKEAAEACNLEPESEGLIERAGQKLMADLNLEAVLITESENGMTLFEGANLSTHYDAAAKEVYDVTGAGDTVAATLGVALAAGMDLQRATNLANKAAGIVVQQVGTAAITVGDLATVLRDDPSEVRSN